LFLSRTIISIIALFVLLGTLCDFYNMLTEYFDKSRNANMIHAKEEYESFQQENKSSIQHASTDLKEKQQSTFF